MGNAAYIEEEIISSEEDLKGILKSVKYTKSQIDDFFQTVEQLKSILRGKNQYKEVLEELSRVERVLRKLKEKLDAVEGNLISEGKELGILSGEIDIELSSFNKDFPESDYQKNLRKMERLAELSNETFEKMEEDPSSKEVRLKFLDTLSQLTETLEAQNQLEKQENEKIRELMNQVRKKNGIDKELINSLIESIEKAIRGLREIVNSELEVSNNLTSLISNELDLLRSLKSNKTGTPLTVQNLSKFGGKNGLSSVIEDDAKDIILSNRKDYGKEPTHLNHDDNYERNQELNYLVWDPEKRIFVMDHHDYALMAWNAGLNSGLFSEETDLLHIDDHEDYQEPNFYPEGRFKSIEQAEKYTESVGIGRFIKPAERQNVVGNVTLLTSIRFQRDSKKILNYLKNEKRFILDLDLDFFFSTKNRVEIEKHYKVIAFLVQKASFTTIALSPTFINQKEAKDHLNKIMNLYGNVGKEEISEILLEWTDGNSHE